MTSRFQENYERRLREQATHKGPAQGQTMSNYVPGDRTPFTEAVGYGMKTGGAGLGNLILRATQAKAGIPWSRPIEDVGPFSDSAIAEDKRLFRSGGLADQPGAGVGRFIGEALTVPGPGRATQAARSAPGFMGRVLGQRAAPRAFEGAVGAAQFSSPEDAASNAGTGAALSMTLGRLGDTAGRVGRGVVRKSEDAEQLELMLRNSGQEGVHIPLSLSYSKEDVPSRLIGGTYKNASPFFPLAGDILEDQRRDALRKVRGAAYTDSAPEGFRISPDDLKNPPLLHKKIQDEFDRLYQDTVKSYAFNVPSDYLQQMRQRILAADPKINKTSLNDVLGRIDELMAKFSDGSGQIEGQNLLYYKDAVGRLLKGAPREERAAIRAAVGWVDEHIADELKVGNVPQNLKDLLTYEKLSPAWRSFRAVVDSARSAPGGEFSMQQLARKTRPLTPESELARTADRVLGESATRFTPAGRAMAGAMTMGAGIGLGTGLGGAAAATGAGLLATTKPTQRFLTGDTTLQQTLRNLSQELHKRGIEPGNVLTQTRRGIVAEHGEE